MRVSDLIDRLTRLKEKHGDLPVLVPTSYPGIYCRASLADVDHCFYDEGGPESGYQECDADDEDSEEFVILS